jgi:hypothetical protein
MRNVDSNSTLPDLRKDDREKDGTRNIANKTTPHLNARHADSKSTTRNARGSKEGTQKETKSITKMKERKEGKRGKTPNQN